MAKLNKNQETPVQDEQDSVVQPMTWKDRLLLEKDELSEKLTKLRTFLDGDQGKLPFEDYKLLVEQSGYMADYLRVLEIRCERLV